jgi:molybdopterin biosynthesis enzyme MoaB
VLDGSVRDTNLEAAQEVLGAAGYEVVSGGTVEDDERAIAGRIARLIADGFGLVVTTGGVGAEDKDCTIEALQLLDPGVATAVLAHYQVGQGRHVKDSVRIGVASVGWSLVVALPGPTREVRVALPVLVAGLRAGLSAEALAESIAAPIRDALKN